MNKAAGILFIANGKALLLKRGDGYWGLPGGHLEPGETDREAAIRETFEECQYRVRDPIERHSVAISPEVSFTTFLCEVPEEFRPVLNHEHTAYLWTSEVPDSTHPMLTNILRGIMIKRHSRDATNHLGEKTYRTYAAWRAACKVANPSVRFEGDSEICHALPNVGEWDGETGVVYAQKAKDALSEADKQARIQRLSNRMGVSKSVAEKELIAEEWDEAEAALNLRSMVGGKGLAGKRSEDASPKAEALKRKIEELSGSLGLAREKRKMKTGGAQHYQSQREMDLSKKISELRQELHLLESARDSSDLEKTYTSEFLKRFDVAKMKRLGYQVVSEAKNPEGTYMVTYRKRSKDAVEGVVYKTLAEAKVAAERTGGKVEQKFDTSKEPPYNTYWIVKPAAKDAGTFKEEEHPREGGKFTSKGGSSKTEKMATGPTESDVKRVTGEYNQALASYRQAHKEMEGALQEAAKGFSKDPSERWNQVVKFKKDFLKPHEQKLNKAEKKANEAITALSKADGKNRPLVGFKGTPGGRFG